jgi:hypothetical protein
MKRILMLSLVLALLAAMVISTAAFAQGPNGGSDGSQARQGATAQNGATYGPGDGTGPVGREQFGPGPHGTCADANNNGVCDCQES